MRNEIKYVEALYKERNFSRAAKILYISQPALSIAIKKLEEELGSPLFDRSGSTIIPTEACEFYLQASREIMAIEENITAYFDSIKNLNAGSLKIGATTFYCCYSLPITVHPFSAKYPNIAINLIENASNQGLVESLKDGTLDLVLTSNQNGFEQFNKQLFDKEYLILAVPASYKINQKLRTKALSAKDILEGKHRKDDCPSVSLKLFGELPYISLRPDSDLYQRVMEMFAKTETKPNFHMYVDQMPTSFFMTTYGYGYSIIRDTTLKIVPVSQNEKDQQVIYYRINDPLSIRDINFFYRSLMYQSAAVKAFLEYVEERKESQ